MAFPSIFDKTLYFFTCNGTLRSWISRMIVIPCVTCHGHVLRSQDTFHPQFKWTTLPNRPRYLHPTFSHIFMLITTNHSPLILITASFSAPPSHLAWREINLGLIHVISGYFHSTPQLPYATRWQPPPPPPHLM